MITTNLQWIAKHTQGKLEGEDLTLSSISTDTRSIQDGDLFIALVGDNFNAHQFAKYAVESGAIAIVASEPVDVNVPVIYVEDTTRALGQIGAAVKDYVSPKTIAITGSSGKTTVKEMTAAILSRRGKVLSTAGNFNNEIGVPLTLLRLQPEHDFAVVELGANHLGEIAYTSSLVKPDVATIVNAAAAHLEGFGSLFGVARAKSEIFKGLGEDGSAIVNVDSQFAEYWLGKVKRLNTITFSPQSKNSHADFTAEDIIIGVNGCAEFTLVCPKGQIAISLSIPGQHNVGNALLAASLAIEVGASLEDVQMGLLHMTDVAGRMQMRKVTEQFCILDDSYNANVGSVKAAIDTLSSFAGKRILILGDMAELGEKARHYHEEVGQYANSSDIDSLYTVGVLSQSASTAFEREGSHFSDINVLIEALEQNLSYEQRDLTILVKGSRSARMERVVAALEGSSLGKYERRREKIAC